jgi:DNA-binding response OmpR family regulator
MKTIKDDTENANILIVDDNSENLRLLSKTLAQKGYTVCPAKSGKIALAAVGKKAPDLFLLDIMMPEMDGYELCRRLKAGENLKDIPVIFLTARSASEDIVKGFELGAVDYVLKPFRIPELLSRVETHIKLRKTIVRLQAALDHIQTLEGMLPICAACKKIRDDNGQWNQIESYIRKRTNANFTHSICPDCARELYPDFKYPKE